MNFINYVHTSNHRCKIIIGDFNLPLTSWKKESSEAGALVPTSNRARPFERELLSILDYYNRMQINGNHNSRGRLLDLVFIHDKIYAQIDASEGN